MEYAQSMCKIKTKMYQTYGKQARQEYFVVPLIWLNPCHQLFDTNNVPRE